MITSQSAKEMLVIVGELLELCGKYWSSYRSLPNLDSPQEAWALYDVMRQKQKVIAQKLDKDALDIKWEEIMRLYPTRQPIQHPKRFDPKRGIDSSISLELATRVGNLIYLCNTTSKDKNQMQRMILHEQRRIAELLDPDVFKSI